MDGLWLDGLPSSRQVKVLKKKKKTGFPQSKMGFYQQTGIFAWISSLPAYSVDFGLPSFQNHLSRFLKLSLSVSMSLFLSISL